MKKSILLIFVFVCILFLTGCNGTVTRDLRHDGFNLVNGKVTCSDIIPKKDEKAKEKADFINANYMITENGDIYEVSFGQVYANQENCKKASTTFKVAAMMDENILKGEDGKLYYAPGNNGSPAYQEITANDSSIESYRTLLAADDVKKVITIDQSKGLYYVLSTDGNVYEYQYTKNDYNSPSVLKSKTILYDSETFKGNILDFNYNITNPGQTYIRTKDVIYRKQVTNLKKCTKYADITCKYVLKKDKTLTKYYNEGKILYYGANGIITSYGALFS